MVDPGGLGDTVRSPINTYILGKVAGLVALTALDALGRARLGALLGHVALHLAVLAGVRVDAGLGAVAGAVALFLAVDALNGGLMGLLLGDVLLAVLDEM
jgi:hypothetical protein